ncbi:epoxide hydrolase family protein [Sphingomonas sp.]|uniref:epoxide hydrolase family protein n=1 Tax=Sphingomonas sp. TaxID=28214 RepID=UPI0035C85F01
MDDSVQPFRLSIPDSAIEDLYGRLDATRWPEPATVDDWSQGVPLDAARELCRHWREGYDWRRCEAELNQLGQFRTEIDGCGIHFVHVRSPEPHALPLVMTHGWPGSVIEFLDVIGPLTNPRAHGGDPGDAFHVVAPSLPGYGFSDRPRERWGVPRIARAWITLMTRLGYPRFVAQGGDWGSAVTNAIALTGAPEVLGIHLNMVVALPDPADLADLTDVEKAALADLERYRRDGNGYAIEQSTRPQTIGYGLVDSPAAQAMWIYEKFAEWTDSGGTPETVLSRDRMLDNIMLYWLPGTGASSARLYWESFRDFSAEPVSRPVACSIFPKELFRTSRRWAERKYPQIVHWNELDRGGHFAAFEQPALFVEEVRAGFRPMR